jgi:hypothetical protein
MKTVSAGILLALVLIASRIWGSTAPLSDAESYALMLGAYSLAIALTLCWTAAQSD